MSTDLYIDLPAYNKIDAKKVPTELKYIIDTNLDSIDKLLADNNQPTWDNLIQPMETLGDNLHNYWSTISHMHSVVNSESLREAYNACLPMLSDYHTAISHNKKLYAAVQAIAKAEDFSKLSAAQQKVIENDLRDFKLAGVALSAEKKAKFADIAKQLSELSAKFEQNLLDATQAWHYHTTDEKDLIGLPATTLHLAKAAAAQKQLDGWCLTLDMPVYHAVMTYADNRQLREKFYYAYTTRASDQGPNAGQNDNTAIIDEILALRHELAVLLGFANYAEYSLATKMADEPAQVLEFLQELLSKCLPKAKQDVAELEEFAKTAFGIDQLQAWDTSYYSEKLRQAQYAISQEDLRPYFAEANVLEGLFLIVNKLFGLSIKQRQNVDTWHKDVRCYEVYDENNQLRALFLIDLYARENKRGGAWMDECRVRRKTDTEATQVPIAYLTCNLNPPAGDIPALFTHDEVVTLFHEFGHCLQHMLTTVDHADVSGINGIPWDAVEVASQFLENWAWQKQSLNLFAKHWQTGEQLPDELFQKMERAKNFHRAMMIVRQLEFALFDFTLHLDYQVGVNHQAQDTLNAIRTRTALLPTPTFNRFQNGFAHIFAGGYAAGYYSYLWAEVMSADAFSLFLQNGVFDRSTSQKFMQCILEPGGTEEPSKLFKAFRGRDPQVDALLQQADII